MSPVSTAGGITRTEDRGSPSRPQSRRVCTRLTLATGTAEREAALDMVPAIPVRRSAGRVRKCIEEVGIEEVFGWSKATAGFRKTRHCGLARVN